MALCPARLLRALVIASCLFPLLQACGGRSDTEDYLFDGDGTISIGASASTAGRSSTGGTRPSGGSNGTGGAGVAGSTPNPTGGVSVGGSGPIPGAGTTGIGGNGTAGMPQAGNATGGTSGSPITCGNQVCDSASQNCCAAFGGVTCVGRNQDCEGAVLGCTVNADCAGGDVCCISITGDIDAASSCKARCDNTGTGRDRQLCQSADECRDPFMYCTPTIFGVNICTRRP